MAGCGAGVARPLHAPRLRRSRHQPAGGRPAASCTSDDSRSHAYLEDHTSGIGSQALPSCRKRSGRTPIDDWQICQDADAAATDLVRQDLATDTSSLGVTVGVHSDHLMVEVTDNRADTTRQHLEAPTTTAVTSRASGSSLGRRLQRLSLATKTRDRALITSIRPRSSVPGPTGGASEPGESTARHLNSAEYTRALQRPSSGIVFSSSSVEPPHG
jgi:hypothetical protein